MIKNFKEVWRGSSLNFCFEAYLPSLDIKPTKYIVVIAIFSTAYPYFSIGINVLHNNTIVYSKLDTNSYDITKFIDDISIIKILTTKQETQIEINQLITQSMSEYFNLYFNKNLIKECIIKKNGL